MLASVGPTAQTSRKIGGRRSWATFAAWKARRRTHKTTWRNNLEAWQLAHKNFHAWQGPDDVSDELCDAETEAWREMLDTPAPDRAALRMKLEQLLKIDSGLSATNAWDADEVRQTIADVARLLADA